MSQKCSKNSMENEKVNGDIKILLQTIIAQNTEIKKDIEKIRTDINLQSKLIKDTNDRIAKLEIKNTELTKELQNVQRQLKKNNIIIFGIHEDETNLLNTVQTCFKEKLNIDINEQEIDNIYRIGKLENNKSRPIILQLTSYLKKQSVLKEAHQLKNTGIGIANDLIPEDRQDKKLLWKYFKEAKNKTVNVKIVKQSLLIDNKKYSLQDLQKKEQEVLTSPSTVQEKQLVNKNKADRDQHREEQIVLRSQKKK